jgi:hypothetical protein
MTSPIYINDQLRDNLLKLVNISKDINNNIKNELSTYNKLKKDIEKILDINSVCLFHEIVIDQSGYTKPYPGNSNLFFISLPVNTDQKNTNNLFGKEIFDRYKTIDQKVLLVNKSFLSAPHMTIFTLYIPDNDFYKFITNDENTDKISNIIKDNFNKHLKNIQLKNGGTNAENGIYYKKLGLHTALNFSINDQNNQKYIQFTNELIFELIKLFAKITDKDDFNNKIKIEENIKPFQEKNTASKQTFTHYSLKDKGCPESLFALSSYNINWLPHITIHNDFIKDTGTSPDNLLFNLWHVDDQINSQCGSISDIFISFNKRKFKLIDIKK